MMLCSVSLAEKRKLWASLLQADEVVEKALSIINMRPSRADVACEIAEWKVSVLREAAGIGPHPVHLLHASRSCTQGIGHSAVQ